MHCERQGSVRQFVFSVKMRYVEARKRVKLFGGKVREEMYLPQRKVSASRGSRASVTLFQPWLDIKPVALFKKENSGRSPLDMGIPVVSITRLLGPAVTGVVFYSDISKNIEPGCFRMPLR